MQGVDERQITLLQQRDPSIVVIRVEDTTCRSKALQEG